MIFFFMFVFYNGEIRKASQSIKNEFKNLDPMIAAKKSDEKLEFMKTQVTERYMWFFLIIAYSILPSVTTSIFRTYPCVTVDPDEEDNEPAAVKASSDDESSVPPSNEPSKSEMVEDSDDDEDDELDDDDEEEETPREPSPPPAPKKVIKKKAKKKDT